MTQNYSVTAHFTLSFTQLSVSLDGHGMAYSNPLGIICASDQASRRCTATFDPGTEVTLVAAPAPGKLFGGWGGACSGTSLTCVVVMDQNKAVSATFASIRSRTYLPWVWNGQ